MPRRADITIMRAYRSALTRADNDAQLPAMNHAELINHDMPTFEMLPLRAFDAPRRFFRARRSALCAHEGAMMLSEPCRALSADADGASFERHYNQRR